MIIVPRLVGYPEHFSAVLASTRTDAAGQRTGKTSIFLLPATLACLRAQIVVHTVPQCLEPRVGAPSAIALDSKLRDLQGLWQEAERGTAVPEFSMQVMA